MPEYNYTPMKRTAKKAFKAVIMWIYLFQKNITKTYTKYSKQ